MEKPGKINKKEKPETLEVKEERLKVGKKKVETGKVTLTRKVLEEEVPVDLTTVEEEIEVEVKKIGRVVDKPGEAVRQEGDSTVYAVYREEYVKQTILEEEVWLTKRKNKKTFESPQKLRREVIEVNRTSKNDPEGNNNGKK